MTEASTLARSACGFGAAGEELSTGGALGVGAGVLLGGSDVVGALEVGAEGAGSAKAGAANTPVSAAPAAIVAR
ncbi:hypothetical protein [Amycolatopsis sp. TNS106]|uniref:hypothetical protein n=1 Tax=Amycolatopsis sp. TNS106 TaxID=2861750 RepID=UPI002107413D|nr:hypothetical protein [Amycolatopsis sp. TNS106]